MGIAILTIVDLLMPLQSLASRFMPARRGHSSSVHRAAAGGLACPPPESAPGSPLRTDATGSTSGSTLARPLRVVRVEAHQAGHRSGRVVISGRIADVCAELDRLAALEAAQAARLH
ncbi:hypothetical protein [Variovorax ginsengisoli]|uniref:Uncharacterized protein n=1 Tax=Variovorax ginsengisoli TaxID=363844 RepID=A0ABT9S3R3_9BURK|nr:hypothetical protein [Variovorax ginsengisoli]MDP9898978.1 hypothetical protein [Variovorax ginsengisoli]